MSGVLLSKAIKGGLDINCSGITVKPGGGMSADTDKWQLAMSYAILLELKTLKPAAQLPELHRHPAHAAPDRPQHRTAT